MPLPTRTASRRTSLRLLASLVLVLTLSACALPWSAASSPTAPSHATVEAGTPVVLNGGAWQRIALPTAIPDVTGYAVSPSAPNTLFACTDTPALRTLWRTTDAGAHWTSYGALAGTGTGCLFSFAPDDPQRVTVQVSTGVEHVQPCTTDTFYLSGDAGQTWKRLPPLSLSIPASAPYDSCALQASQHHLYLSFTSSEPAHPGSLLARSDDDGQTWRRIDGTLGDGAFFFMPQIGPDDHLAMTILHISLAPTAAPSDTALWTSTNAGDTWAKASDLPGNPGGFLLSSPPTGSVSWPSVQRPFYALVSEQIPSDLYYEHALASADGLHWAQVPNLPIPGVSDQRHGILQVLATLPDGRLAIWGANLHASLPDASAVPEPQTQFWLWLWNPTTNAWQPISSPLNVSAHESCGLCWQGASSLATNGDTYLYAARLYTDPFDEDLGLFRLRIP